MEILMFFIGFIIGCGVMTFVVHKLYYCGQVRVDRSESRSRPYFFLELDKEPADASKQKFMLLSVKNEDLASRK